MMTARERIEDINRRVVTTALYLLRDAFGGRHMDRDVVLPAAHHCIEATQRLDLSREWRVKIRPGANDIHVFGWLAACDGDSR